MNSSENSKSVLIITRDFPPHCSRGGWTIRMASLANFLTQNHCKVYVIATQRAKIWPTIYISPKVKVFWVKHWLEYYNLPRFDFSFNLFYLFIKIYRRFLSVVFENILIDVNHLSYKNYYHTAKKLIQDDGIQNVIISSPPHSLHLIGLQLKKDFKDRINLITDFRDPWTLRKKYQVKDKYRMEELEKIEQQVALESDWFVLVSQGMVNMYAKKIRLCLDKIKIIENGFTQIAPSQPDQKIISIVEKAKQQNRLVIGYFGVGGISQKRNDGKSFNRLFSVLNRNSSLAQRLCLIVQGDFASDGEIPDKLLFASLPNTSYSNARGNMLNVDVGLMIYTETEDAPFMMGGKVYDYIASGIALLFMAPSNSESLIALCSKTEKPFLADVHSDESIENTLSQIIEKYDNKTLKNFAFTSDEIDVYSRENQYKQFLDILR
ncbi:hypothetical protein [Oscillatoria acuminata]|uniref:Glycosyltransferase subfamily 4-like N-terminal domain-containing protein n=1 Tax=Oscillatoria acuminata PCC 6304 TaxID=56110 RepID=K9TG85_9CYAN|nr:hypothetical protein [Oscillatoria acuminata]AFY81398.1 hypothetical protein Oscil6304_1704 [Oscillatoria acuminata PCC 6304]